MTKQTRQKLYIILTLWIIAFIGLNYILIRDINAPVSALIGIFKLDVPLTSTPILVQETKVEEVAVEEEPEEEEPKLSLLPKGNKESSKESKATFQVGDLINVASVTSKILLTAMRGLTSDTGVRYIVYIDLSRQEFMYPKRDLNDLTYTTHC